MWPLCRTRMDPHPKFGFDVKTDAHTHTPKSIRNFITHTMRLYEGEQGSSKGYVNMAWNFYGDSVVGPWKGFLRVFELFAGTKGETSELSYQLSQINRYMSKAVVFVANKFQGHPCGYALESGAWVWVFPQRCSRSR